MIRILWMLSILVPMSAALAQDWPARPVRGIGNVAAGRVSDVAARLIGSVLADALKQPFVIDNRAGGEGYIGFEAAARAEPARYTAPVRPGRLDGRQPACGT